VLQTITAKIGHHSAWSGKTSASCNALSMSSQNSSSLKLLPFLVHGTTDSST